MTSERQNSGAVIPFPPRAVERTPRQQLVDELAWVNRRLVAIDAERARMADIRRQIESALARGAK